MTTRSRMRILTLALSPMIALAASAAGPEPGAKAMAEHYRGTFEVKMSPLTKAEPVDGTTLGKMVLEKQFHGDLDALAKGEMLTAMTSTKGSAGYVAIERVTGTLKGRAGSFVVQHNGVMDRGKPSVHTVVIVPDSGSGALSGISGSMTIAVEGDEHRYDLEATLPDPK